MSERTVTNVGSRMTQRVSAGLRLACGAAALVAATGASAQEGVAIKNLLGSVGIIAPERDPIRYRERAPLVLPPKSELREPMASSLATADPQWPNDPDMVARRRKAAEERRPVLDSEIRRMSERDPRLTNQEMAASRTDRRETGRPGRPLGDNSREALYVSAEELRPARARGDEALPESEPNRRTLTDPPSGMRRSASGGAVRPSYDPRVDQQAVDASPLGWIRRQFSSSDDD